MKNYNLKAMKNQAGMTLIELTVVLLVLIGLAGLTLPYVGGFISKTHNSTSADSGAALFNALQVYQASYQSFPQGLNILTAGTSTAPLGTTAAPYLDNTAQTATAWATTVLPTNFTAFSDVAGGIAKSLSQAGINYVTSLPQGLTVTNPDGTFKQIGGIATNGATFTAENPSTIISNTSTTSFVTDTINSGLYVSGAANSSGIANALLYTTPVADSNHKMIVLGIGQGNSAINKTLASVPIHFGDKASLQPANTYSRFMAAFDVDTTGVNAAKLIGIVHAPDVGDQWESLYSSLNAYYQN